MGPLNPVAHGTILTFLPLNRNIYAADKATIINTPPNARPKTRGILFFLSLFGGGGDCNGGGDREGEGEGDGEGALPLSESGGEATTERLACPVCLLVVVKDSSRLLTVLFSEDLK